MSTKPALSSATRLSQPILSNSITEACGVRRPTPLRRTAADLPGGKHPAEAAMGWLSGGSGSGFAQLPVPGEELVQLGGRMIGNAAQYVGKPGLWICGRSALPTGCASPARTESPC
jgi:hypothetical protein